MRNKITQLGLPVPLASIIFALLCLVVSANSNAFSVSDTIMVSDDRFSQRISEGVLYLEDVDAELSVEDVISGRLDEKFRAFSENTLQMGYNNNPFWFKLSVKNNLSEHTTDNLTDRFYISVRYPLLDSVQFYHIASDSVQSLIMGDALPFDQRYFDLNNYVFPISLYREEVSDIYIRVQTENTLSVPIFIETERAFIGNQHIDHIYNGIYLGITIGLLIYNCFLWLGIRKSVYGFYALSILSILFFNATIAGYTYRVWPSAVAFQQVAVYLLSTFAGVAVCWFTLVFLDAKRSQPKMYKFLLFMTVVYSACLPVMLIVPPLISSKINILITVSGVCIVVTMAVRSLLHGYRPAAYYLIGQGAVLFSVIFTVLTSQGVVPLYYMAPEVLKWCSAFELIFFSVALADLVNSERRLRETAQMESVQAQKELLSSQIELNDNLDKLVQERTTELQYANQLLQELNTRDELTSLRNRRYLNEVYPKEYKRAYRDRSEISVLMLDIDFFKQINDNHGHQLGDRCLSMAGKIITDHLHRPSDFAVRYGGEEFVVVLADTSLSGAVRVAENICKSFESNPIPTAEGDIQVTVSIGVVSDVPMDRFQHESLLRLADDLLYQAKQNGRNRVESLAASGDVLINRKETH